MFKNTDCSWVDSTRKKASNTSDVSEQKSSQQQTLRVSSKDPPQSICSTWAYKYRGYCAEPHNSLKMGEQSEQLLIASFFLPLLLSLYVPRY